ncbi:glycoside hydrolase family 3 C-terminal domain-containing protein [Paenibacillus sp. N1-5-1-14]|uniref:glycoside hydrolase family 3 C-terminal domain-containing protein n=1 Tax=Paenibacillus radicibacter TaxID=2972488 RepID=UPI002159A9BC|nr:glycoside hydrolase family 3 C-terminal domain-containing protein [Paenibacillus radicibacter]MCR8641105.1 glycoside hydrolase family 3 C-terminal domain-containing protein [Paenibacillus radicibacter]
MTRNIQALIEQMTLEEKASLCSGLDFWHMKGVERLGIPSLMVTDGPHGLRKQDQSGDHLGLLDSVPATCFPSAAGLASSWDRELVTKLGVALGETCQAEDVSILLGPGVNIKRSPLNGRNFEYFSEDPYLSTEMATSYIQAVQSQGVGTSMKHYAVNNQEHRRMSVDAIVDERTLREIYLASFEGAVKNGQPWTVMSSYNRVNGTYASENEYLLTGILQKEWGHEGFVVSDWGAVDERVPALDAGLALEMPANNGLSDKKIVDAVNNGKLSLEKLNQTVEQLLTIIFKCVDNKKENATYDRAAQHQLARQVASESMVLLKNEASLLPLQKNQKVALIGSFAIQPRYQGGGSSHIKPTQVDIPLDEITKLSRDNGQVSYAQGYEINADQGDQELIGEAKNVAYDADVAVVFVGLPDRYESEGYDRTHLQLPANQTELIHTIAAVQRNVVIVLMNGSAVEMPWIHEVGAVVEAYLGGQAVGGAIADVLYGIVNPSGKLAETFPLQLSDTPAYMFFPGESDRVEYREGIFVGYRYYDTKNMKPLFPFGHGLSYTTFSYSDLKIDRTHIHDTETVDVHVTVENTGNRAGKEVIQLYVKDNESLVARPNKELKSFAKLELQPGEKKTVTFTLDKHSFAYYNVELKDWHVETGDFSILIGRSSADIVLQDTLHVTSTVAIKKTYTRNTPMVDLMQDTSKAHIVQGFMEQVKSMMPVSSEEAGEASDMMAAVMKFMPLRALVSFSSGAFTDQMLEGLLAQLNQD